MKEPENDVILSKYVDSFDLCDISDEVFFGTYILYKLRLEYENIKKSTSNKVSFRPVNFYEAVLDNNLENAYDQNVNLMKLAQIPSTIQQQLKDIDDKIKHNINYIEPILKTPSVNWFSTKIYKQILMSHEVLHPVISEMNPRSFTNKSMTVPYISLVMSTYVDWDRVSVSPYNLLRDFNNFGNKSININEYLNLELPIIDLYKYVKQNISEDCLKTQFENQINNLTASGIVLNIAGHPTEYTVWTLRNIVNAYILLTNLICMFPHTDIEPSLFHNSLFWPIYALYENIICEEFDIDIDINRKLRFVFNTHDKYHSPNLILLNKLIDQLDITVYHNKLTNLYGTPITGSTLVEAMTHGALFIRKCTNSSMIDSYSPILKQCNIDYQYNVNDYSFPNKINDVNQLPRVYDVNNIFKSMLPLKNSVVTTGTTVTSPDKNILQKGGALSKYKYAKNIYLILKKMI